ncbi:triacylglycerol lipase [Histoplasma capsulatum var. duboisii H88]|uniref:Patatin-like phospholipase domain-containing protein n=2 Tax=Ajellomyces capsulatus TaxID=5037 RepID=A0A8A1LHM0_AJEC8|nr:triacylglycerol lipase [Histoplasma capsulatum H143]QSS52415.1 triacylglycerol lipase [Histoplasma capsulatum var. duboisii H88]
MPHLRDQALVSISCQRQNRLPISLTTNPRPGQDLSCLRKLTANSLFSFVLSSVSRAGGAILNLRAKPAKAEELRIKERKHVLSLRLRDATSLHDWLEIAGELDELDGNNDWKATFECDEYDPMLVQRRLSQLEKAQRSCDAAAMIHIIRTSLSRDLGGMTNKNIYKHSRIGTKNLIDQYITTAAETLSTLLDVSRKYDFDGSESRYLLEQLLAARQAFGRSALLLSGGATFGMNHIGVAKALWETRLLPRIISGSSAGSIVGAVLCVYTDEEMPEILANVGYGDFSVFSDDDDRLQVFQRLMRFIKHGSFYDIAHLTRVMRDLLGDVTFQEAYNRTRRILNIGVSNAGIYELPRLLNYITAPNVLIWSAVATSCSVPLIFSSSSLMAKDPITGDVTEWHDAPHRWIDGSVDHDLPMTRLSEMFNVNHFIVSQVNPHVVPFIPHEETFFFSGVVEKQLESSWMQYLTGVAREEALHRMHILSEIGVFPNILRKLRSIMSQRYHGDINILPQIPYDVFPNILRNPTSEFMVQACLSGERATWPKLGRIRNHCAVELALDSAVQTMRARVIFRVDRVDPLVRTVIARTPDQSALHQRRIRAQRSCSFDAKAGEVSQAIRRPAHKLRKSRSSASHENFGFDITYSRIPTEGLGIRPQKQKLSMISTSQKTSNSSPFTLGLEPEEDQLDIELPQNFRLPEPILPNETPYSNMSEWASASRTQSPSRSRRPSNAQVSATIPTPSTVAATAVLSAAALPALIMSSGSAAGATSPSEQYRRTFRQSSDPSY